MVEDQLLSKPWTNFVRGSVILDLTDAKTQATIKQAAQTFNVTEEQVIEQFREADRDEIWLNSRYQVNVRRHPAPPSLKGLQPDLVHLSIKRLDKDTHIPWRDKQRIKNELVGEEFEAVELFPAESRLVDTANQYHLWCFAMPGYRFPIGWEHRHVLDAHQNLGNSVQAELDKLPVEGGWRKLSESCQPDDLEFCLYRSKNEQGEVIAHGAGTYGDDWDFTDHDEWMPFPV